MNSIIVPSHFIRASRDAGYRGLVFAISELIDNSLDAKATDIQITLLEERCNHDREITIAVVDNGHGMDNATLWEALRFGGSSGFGGRTRLGRYGMGLPNSSVSQTMRVDVYTWKSPMHCYHTYLDVEQIASKRVAGIPRPISSRPPMWVKAESKSGTVVIWSRCDRLRYRKAVTVSEKLRAPLGRIFRVALASGVRITVNGDLILPVDPLLRNGSPELPGGCERVGEPLEYRIRTDRGGYSSVTVEFVELPVSRWHDVPLDAKRRAGIIGGGGMSVLRGGREIDHGWHLFGNKRRENYDDWWRCELRFEPALDEVFGITFNKQGINPTIKLRDIVEADLEAIARDLNRRVRSAFLKARKRAAKRATVRATQRDKFLPPIESSLVTSRVLTNEGYAYQIRSGPMSGAEFMRVSVVDNTLDIVLNENHPFYAGLYRRLASTAVEEAFDMLLLSMARAMVGLPADAAQAFVRNCSDNLAVFLNS